MGRRERVERRRRYLRGVARVAVATRDLAASTIGILESLLGDDPKDPTWSMRESATLDALADALRANGDAETRIDASISDAARAFVFDALLPGFLARETRDASQRRCARTWMSALGVCRRLLKAVEGGGSGVQGDDAERLVSRTLAAPSAAMLDAVVGVGEMNHHAAAAVATLFDILAEQMERAVERSSGVSGERSAPTSAVAAPQERSTSAVAAPPVAVASFPFPFPRHAPTASAQVGGYFPFPGAPAARPAARPAAGPAAGPAERSAAGPADASGARALEDAAAAAEEEHTAEDERRRLDASRAAAAASLSTPAAARLLRASVAAAVASVAAAALAAPVAASSGGAFSSLGRSSDDAARDRQVARHRATLLAALDRARATVASEARESARFDGGAGGASAPLPPAPSFAAATPGRLVGVSAVRARGSHRAAEAWTRPRERLAGVSAAGVRLLRAAQRAARVVDGAASLVAAYAAATQAAAALLREPEAAGYGPDIATLDDVLRAMRVETTRLPPRPGTVARGNRGRRRDHRQRGSGVGRARRRTSTRRARTRRARTRTRRTSAGRTRRSGRVRVRSTVTPRLARCRGRLSRSVAHRGNRRYDT